jgi:hypothetical protein
MPKQKRRSWMPKEGYYKVVGGKKYFVVTGENHNAKTSEQERQSDIREDA